MLYCDIFSSTRLTRPHSQRFCVVAVTVKFHCMCDVAKSFRMGPEEMTNGNKCTERESKRFLRDQISLLATIVAVFSQSSFLLRRANGPLGQFFESLSRLARSPARRWISPIKKPISMRPIWREGRQRQGVACNVWPHLFILLAYASSIFNEVESETS